MTTVVMEYAQHTWRLPLPSTKRCTKPNLPPRATSENCAATPPIGSSFIDTGNLFNMLDEIDNVDDENWVPDYLNQYQIEGRFQQRYELMLKQRDMAVIYHTSHGHFNNRHTVLNLQAKGVECNHLKRYILAHRCNACDAAPGRRYHKVKATAKAKRKTKSTSKTVASVGTAIAPAFESQNPLTEHLDSEFSTITDAIDPTVPITESLARLFQHTSKNPCDYPNIAQMRNMSDTTKEPAENITVLPPRAVSGNDTTNGEGATTSANTTTPLFSPPGTELRMD